MFHESFMEEDVSRMFFFKGVSGLLRMFAECFKEVSRKLSRLFKKVSCAWHSSQLPEQKEGLFLFGLESHVKIKKSINLVD